LVVAVSGLALGFVRWWANRTDSDLGVKTIHFFYLVRIFRLILWNPSAAKIEKKAAVHPKVLVEVE
jgi:hypothetical protein